MKNAKIMLVDDAKFARKIALRALENGGFDNVVQAITAVEAMEVFEKENPDLVLLDITLPDNSDLTLLGNMLNKNPKAKVIMVSAIGQELIIEDSLNMGAKAFITKPYSEREFLEVIYNILDNE